MVIGDVGQGAREEVDLARSPSPGWSAAAARTTAGAAARVYRLPRRPGGELRRRRAASSIRSSTIRTPIPTGCGPRLRLRDHRRLRRPRPEPHRSLRPLRLRRLLHEARSARWPAGAGTERGRRTDSRRGHRHQATPVNNRSRSAKTPATASTSARAANVFRLSTRRNARRPAPKFPSKDRQEADRSQTPPTDAARPRCRRRGRRRPGQLHRAPRRSPPAHGSRRPLSDLGRRPGAAQSGRRWKRARSGSTETARPSSAALAPQRAIIQGAARVGSRDRSSAHGAS